MHCSQQSIVEKWMTLTMQTRAEVEVDTVEAEVDIVEVEVTLDIVEAEIAVDILEVEVAIAVDVVSAEMTAKRQPTVQGPSLLLFLQALLPAVEALLLKETLHMNRMSQKEI